MIFFRWFFALIFLFSSDFLFAETVSRDVTYYSDSFQGSTTANGDTFEQEAFSAAICGIPLGNYLYVSRGGTGIVVDANDRPSCSRYPNVLDLSASAFRVFAPLSVGRFSPVDVTVLGPSPADVGKSFLPKNTFQNLGVILDQKIPNIHIAGSTYLIQGKVTRDEDYVLVYMAHEGEKPLNFLVPVDREKRFSFSLPLPEDLGQWILVIAAGTAFETDQFANLTLITEDSLRYPDLPHESLRFFPKVDFSGAFPTLLLPEKTYSELILTDGKSTSYRARGTSLVLKDIPFSIGDHVSARIEGYRLSTPSVLDRGVKVSLFSGSVILDRMHDSIGKNAIRLSLSPRSSSFSFVVPRSTKIQPKYYITHPDGRVEEHFFDTSFIDKDGFLFPKKRIKVPLSLSQTGVSLLEILKDDGTAYVNIPVSPENGWSVLPKIEDAKIRNIVSDVSTVRSELIKNVNTLRAGLSLNLLREESELSRLAQAKVDDMIARDYQRHKDPDGNFIDGFARKRGFSLTGALGENIAYGNISHTALQDGLEESGSHRYNMLRPEWKHMGIGYGIKGDRVFLVQIFSDTD